MKNNHRTIRRQPTAGLGFAGLRRHPRKELSVEVLVQDEQGWELPLEALDFSPAGMFVRSHFLFEVGTVHQLIFKSPDGDELFGVRAEVVRVEKDETQGSDESGFAPGMAYEFIETTPSRRARLEGFARRI